MTDQKTSLLFIKPDQAEVICQIRNSASRPEFNNKFKKLLYFIFREGLIRTIVKIRSKKIQSKIESENVLMLAYKSLQGSGDTLIGVGRQWSNNLPYFCFHKDLTATVPNEHLSKALDLLKNRITQDQNFRSYLENFNPFSELHSSLKLSEITLFSKKNNSNLIENSLPEIFLMRNIKSSAKRNLYLIGGGDYARTYVLSNIDHFNRQCVVDHNYNTAQYVARRYGFNYFGIHHLQLLKEIRSEREPVFIISSYHSTHTPIALDVFDANPSAYVFIEKPPVTTEDQLRVLLKLYNSDNIFIGYNRRHIPWVKEVKNKIKHRKSSAFINMTIKEVPLNANHWYYWPNQGTRITGNLCHWIDLSIYWIDSIPKTLALSKMGTVDNLVLTIIFEDGSLVNLFATEVGNSLRGVQERIEIRFDETTILIDDFLKLINLEDGRRICKRKIRRDKGHDRMYRYFQDAVLNHRSDIYSKRDLILSSLTYLKASEMFLEDKKIVELDFSSYQL